MRIFSAGLLLLLTPVVISDFGNKPRDVRKQIWERKDLTSEQCKENIVSWKAWQGGFEGRIKLDSEAKASWEADIELTKPVDLLKSFDAETDVKAGQKFTLKSKNNENEFVIHGKLDKNEKAPLLKSLKVKGSEAKVCREDMPLAEVRQADANRHHNTWPKRTLGLYILLADDTEKGFESESTSWTPELYNWQQEASNVLFFTFIHPETMDIPPSFKKLSDTRGTDAPGAVPNNTVIMFAIGGYSYSIKPNPWHWLQTKEAAEAMAVKVAKWYDEYNMDGIDLDLEEGAGSNKIAGENMVHFIKKVRSLQENMIISQPTYGYPQVHAENHVINESWDTKGNHQGVADIIGLMVYEGTLALQYVKNYAKGSEQWQGFPITINAPTNTILLGCKGSSSSADIVKLARESNKQDLAGIMVWYASIKNGFDYAPFWDASTKQDSIDGYKQAMKILNKDIERLLLKEEEEKEEKEKKEEEVAASAT